MSTVRESRIDFSELLPARPARPSEAGILLELAAQLGYPCLLADFQARLERIISRDDQIILVIEDEEGVCGFVHLSVGSALVSHETAHVDALIVHERARNAGLGQVLCQSAERWARKRGCACMSVHSNVIRERAHNFYRRNGYVEVKEQKYFEKKL
ncbi:MAG TPA: GNAT family N-acetyltransferase [Chroococcales cyanobacterium]